MRLHWRITYRVLLIAALLFACAGAGATVVTGTVSCDGAPVAGVAVSDGQQVVLTGSDGAYKLKSRLELGYVFVSVPSGYEVPSDGVIPRFFARISASEKKARADFALRKVDQSECNIIVYNDIHLVGDRKDKDLQQAHEGFFPDVMALYEQIKDKPVYGLTLGDMTSDNKWYVNNFALPEYLEEVGCFPFQIWHAMGNHDNDMRGGGGDLKSSDTYRRVIGPNYYSLNIGGFHVVVTDNIYYDNPFNSEGIVESARGYHVHLDDMQTAWLLNDLRFVDAATPVILVSHAPFARVTGVENGKDKTKDGFTGGYYSDDILQLFRKFPYVYLLTAHTHENYYVQISPKMLEHNNIGVSAASWKTKAVCGFNMIGDGVPGGYAVYTVKGDSLSWYYKAPGMRMEDCQFRVYDMNSVPAAYRGPASENDIWVNVFNYDPMWRVEVSENGVPLEVMREYLKDPLYRLGVENHRVGQGTFKPRNTNHMFTAHASEAGSTIEVRVTDRFGRVFRQTVERPAYFGLDMNLGNK